MFDIWHAHYTARCDLTTMIGIPMYLLFELGLTYQDVYVHNCQNHQYSLNNIENTMGFQILVHGHY